MYKKLSLVLLTVFAAFVLVACSGDNETVTNNNEEASTTAPAGENVEAPEVDVLDTDGVVVDRHLNVAMPAFPQSMDPTAINEIQSSLINTQMYETLVTRTYDMEIVPALATSWERIDDYTVEFHLREGVYFHNGEPFTAQDVVFSLTRSQAHPITQAIMGVIDPNGFEVIDDHTVRISTTEPFAPLIPFLGHNTAFIVSQVAAEYYGDDFANNPIGTGPFMFDSQVHGDSITLVRNENFHGELPQISGINFRIIPEPAQRLVGLRTGELDLSFDLAPADALTVLNDDDVVLHDRVNNQVRYISLNVHREPFDDVRVRQAFNYVIDTELLIETILEGFGEPAVGPISGNMPLTSRDVTLPTWNVARAQELMAEAGHADGFSITMHVHNAVNQNLAIAISDMLSDINVDVDIVQLESAAFFDVINGVNTADGENGDWDTFIIQFNPGTGDEDNMYRAMFHSENAVVNGATTNRNSFILDEVDGLIDAGSVEFDETARAAIYAQLQALLLEESPWVFLDAGVFLHASRNNVRGYTVRLNGQQTLQHVYIVE